MKESVDETTQLKRALIALKSLRSKLENSERAKTEPIAIVGVGCRFPGGSDGPDRFWQLLRDGVDGVSDVPSDRWDVDAYFDPNPEAVGKMYSRAGGFIDRIDEFDAHFFGIAPREAARMDPQQRLLLEVAWEALENAGQSPATLAGSPTGVFLGMSSADYATMGICKDVPMDPYSGTGAINSVAAGRISYLLGFQGPTLSVDTACSSSLVALHLAVQSLRSGECRMALVGGANAMLLPDMTVYFCKVRAMSAQGRCKTFDASADGYVRGEGCGIVVLKRLSDAVADRDRILAVVRSTAINHDGRSNGLTAPSGNAQQEVLEKALLGAALEPESIDYVEAHGTGTPLGDPIEVQALAAVLGRNRGSGQHLALGSVKTNIGHLEAAAGVAGLIKVVLALQNEEIPPHLHLTKLNPHISWNDLPLQVHTARAPWKRSGRPRRAGISAFGFSGTNAHVIVEEAPSPDPNCPDVWGFQLLTLSAKTGEALKCMAGRLNEALGADAELNLTDVAFTLNCGRSHFGYRLAIVARQLEDARQKLASFEAGRGVLGLRHGGVAGTRPRIAFLFTGQGSQYVGMGRRLFETEPVFREAMEKCDALLRDSLEMPLLEIIYPPGEQQSPIDETAYTQPALFAIEYALAQLWQSWGIQPAAVMGHSIGEYVAACVAGVFSLEDGLRLVAARGRLMQALPRGGRMCAVFAPEQQVLDTIRPYADKVSIASINGPLNVVISGAAEAVEMILESFDQEGIQVQDLTVSHAFHSPLMEPMLAAFEERLAGVKFSAPRIKLISNETGKPVAAADIRTTAYWRRHVRQSVRFSASIETLVADGYDVFLEAGPSPVLIGMGKRCVKAPSALWLASLRKEREDWDQLLDSLSSLYVRGADIAWENFARDQAGTKVGLPTYPFQRQRYWLDLPVERSSAPAAPAIQLGISHPLLGRRIRSAGSDVLFESEISVASPEFLRDHKVHGLIVVPAAYQISLMLAAAEQVGAKNVRNLENVTFPDPLVLAEGESRILQVIATPAPGRSWTIRIAAATEKNGRLSWTTHSSGVFKETCDAAVTMDIPALKCAFVEEVPNVPARYDRIWDGRMELGPSFRWAERIWKKDSESFGSLRAPAESEGRYGLHPGFVDGLLFHILGPLLPDADGPWLPVGIDELHVSGQQPSARVWCHARLDFSSREDGTIRGDVLVASEDGSFHAAARNLRLRRLREEGERDSLLYRIEWKRVEPPQKESVEAGAAWLIISDTVGIGVTVAGLAEKSGGAVQLVRVDRLRDALDKATAKAIRIVHSACLDDVPGQSSVGLLSALQTLQTVALHPKRGRTQLGLITRGAQPADGRIDSRAVGQAALWGLGRVAAMEHPDVNVRLIDLDAGTTVALAAQSLFDEMTRGQSSREIALRGSAHFVPVMVPTHASGTTALSPVRDPSHSWLITGGFGALGLQVAEWLVQHGVRRLVLLGRRGPSAEAQRRLAALESAGVTVVVERADVSELTALESVLARIPQDVPLRGVVHAAGVLDDAVLLHQSPEKLQHVLAPKAVGAWNLHTATRETALDFFILFSSVASLVGSPGQANYAAANAFLDGLAHARKQEGLPALVFNWGPWATSGMAARSASTSQSTVIRALGPAQALQAMGNVMSSGMTQAVVVSVDWPVLSRSFGHQEPAVLADLILAARSTCAEADVDEANQRLKRELETAAPYQRRSLLVSLVRRYAMELLGCAPEYSFNTRQSLLEMGMDSLMATDLRNRLQAALGVTIPATLVFDYPAAESIADYLLNEILSFSGNTEKTDVEEPEPARAAAAASTAASAEIRSLSDEELVRSIVNELAEIRGGDGGE